jgi:peptidoglycan-associated lipoprotein
MEAVEGQKNQTAQVEGEQPEARETQPEETAVEEGEVEEYGVSEEEAEKREKEAAEEKGLSEEAKKTLKTRIHFAFDSSELSRKAQDILKSKAKILKKNPHLKMVIEGHCDERGTDEYNMALGERRARAAYEYLILLGVDADRMNLVSYGEERPLVKGNNEKAWSKNRRNEFKIRQ